MGKAACRLSGRLRWSQRGSNGVIADAGTARQAIRAQTAIVGPKEAAANHTREVRPNSPDPANPATPGTSLKLEICSAWCARPESRHDTADTPVGSACQASPRRFNTNSAPFAPRLP